jgi:hypothetical protein
MQPLPVKGCVNVVIAAKYLVAVVTLSYLLSAASADHQLFGMVGIYLGRV